MDGTVRGLVTRGEEGIDLVVGSVHRAGRPRFFLTLAAHLECGFDERLGLGFFNLRIHGRTSLFLEASWGQLPATGDHSSAVAGDGRNVTSLPRAAATAGLTR